jgi:hypothetical protein
MKQNTEQGRLTRNGNAWRQWGPYLAERAWGTVREDYSATGEAWEYFPHDQARSRTYRWNEDGLAGISDDKGHMCFALALWNGQDSILKERLFGLSNAQGNHGEDVKEYYFYLDSTPSHSYMKMLYKYPQRAYPYADLVETNARRGLNDPEYELFDTGVFDEGRYFDVFVEYAKAAPDDILVRISSFNRGPDAARLVLLPTLWFRNTWGWDEPGEAGHSHKPQFRALDSAGEKIQRVAAVHEQLGKYLLICEGADALLFTENETNSHRLFRTPNAAPFVKDAFHDFIVAGEKEAVNPEQTGTKVGALYDRTVEAGGSVTIRLRLRRQKGASAPAGKSTANWHAIIEKRKAEADDYYAALQPLTLNADDRNIQRQALAGMLWSKEFYHYNVRLWLDGDPTQVEPPPTRKWGRNHDWRHMLAADVISMPDKWEYPWFASWDLGFQCITLALVDAEFAKHQLIMFGREWYLHPNGQVPGYEWNFDGVNPPVMAWAAWRVYKIDKKQSGKGDREFLERAFHKLMLYFTWWVNRKDMDGMNVFQGGFLGLDNIGVFDRSRPLPNGGHIEQCDGTSWMAMFCLDMLEIALELAVQDMAYQDIALKFLEHFLLIAEAMTDIAGEGISLWDEQDEFFYDVLHSRGESEGSQPNVQLRIRSMVGLIPLFAVMTIEPGVLSKVPEFKRRLEWVLENRPKMASLVARWHVPGMGERRLLAILRGHRMKRVLWRMLDEAEFLSPHGVRALSREYAEQPYSMEISGEMHSVRYAPAESDTRLFGGNSNWRGPVWMPVNYLIIEALQRFHHYYSDDFVVECPSASGHLKSLDDVANELSQRLIGIFRRDSDGRRPVFGGNETFQSDPNWRDYIPFHEYFHGDNGAGLGASHQTGWTGLVAKLIQQQGEAGGGTANPRSTVSTMIRGRRPTK